MDGAVFENPTLLLIPHRLFLICLDLMLYDTHHSIYTQFQILNKAFCPFPFRRTDCPFAMPAGICTSKFWLFPSLEESVNLLSCLLYTSLNSAAYLIDCASATVWASTPLAIICSAVSPFLKRLTTATSRFWPCLLYTSNQLMQVGKIVFIQFQLSKWMVLYLKIQPFY